MHLFEGISFSLFNKMKISKTNMTFLLFFEKDHKAGLKRINYFSILRMYLMS
jgi:hypothetical protein